MREYISKIQGIPLEQMHLLPTSAVRFLSRQTYKMMVELMPAVLEDIGTTIEEHEKTAIQSSKSDVYSKSFWEDWIMECPYCKAQAGNNRYSKETFLYPHKSSFCRVVKKRDLWYNAGKDRYSVTCRKCKHKFYFRMGFFLSMVSYSGREYPYRTGR